jgi:pyruvate dehydrogenase E2 component (dihydrolipoamide acetyltransferase)
MPKLGLTMSEGEVMNWLKNEGDVLKKGDEIVEIQTEKLTNVIASPADGILLRIVGRAGDSLPIAATLAYIGEAGEILPDGESENASEHTSENVSANVSERAGKERIKISPAARALAKKLQVEYASIQGTGPGGRIVKADIEARGESGGNAAAFQEAGAAPSERASGTIPYTGMRKAIGVGMHASWTDAPMVTHHVYADVTELLILREQLNKDREEEAVKISVLDIFTKIIAKTLKDFPIVNSRLTDKEILLLGDVNIGIAVALDKGLLVPVVKNADRKSLFEVSREIKELSGRARNGALRSDEMHGGTFTISSIGGYGSVDFFTPIINQPEAAILGICRTRQMPAVVDGEIVVRSLTGLSFTFDHRVIDGAPAAEFLARVLHYLKNPARAVFEG